MASSALPAQLRLQRPQLARGGCPRAIPRHHRSSIHVTAQQQQRQRVQLSPEARAAVYSLRRVNVGEALRRLEDPSLANEPLIGGTTLLHALAEQRDAEAVAALIPAALAAGADPNRPDSQGCGPLFYAANNRDAAAAEAGLQLLLAAGANPNARAYGGLTPLHTAARNGSPEAAAVAIRLLVVAGADVAAQLDRSAGGGRPLHMAVAANDSPAAMEAAVAALLAAGTCVDAPNSSSRGGQTALHIAAQRCSAGKAAAGAMWALLSAGAAVGAVDAGGKQALHLAVGAPATALEAVQALLEAGADPNAACSGSGWRPLHAVALLPDGPAAAQLIALLVSAGARLDAADSEGSTALSWTARNEHQQGSSSGSRSGDDCSSSTPAAAAIAGALLAAGASVHARDAAGRTALHCAAAAAAHNSAAPQLIATLVEAGACLEAEDAAKQTPLQLAAAAAAQGSAAAAAAVQVLLEAGASAGPLLRAL